MLRNYVNEKYERIHLLKSLCWGSLLSQVNYGTAHAAVGSFGPPLYISKSFRGRSKQDFSLLLLKKLFHSFLYIKLSNCQPPLFRLDKDFSWI